MSEAPSQQSGRDSGQRQTPLAHTSGRGAGGEGRRALRAAAVAGTVAAAGIVLWTLLPASADRGAIAAPKAAPARPALTVSLVAPQKAHWPLAIAANGNVAAWQEAVIGAEIGGHPLTEVRVNVGDAVRRGQVLALIASETVAAELAQARAAAEEAQAMLAEAEANAQRARSVQESGALSALQVSQFLTAEQTAQARRNAARARVQAAELRLAQTRVLAPDDGIISARAATVGSLAQPGQELFRLIRGGRLEWRAEVTAAELAQIAPGMEAVVQPPGAAAPVAGRVRKVAPTVDPKTRNALVYVDLPAPGPLRAGMFARGELRVGAAAALTLPQESVVLRDGFAYVYQVGADSIARELKVEVGRRVGDRVEIVRGLDAGTRVVAAGAGFLSDGDLVRVAEAAAGVAARP